jgi:hypothetical protein
MQDTKRFKATWGEGYVNPGSKEITLADITEENGWHSENIDKLESAYIGEVVNCSDISGILFVQRIA